MARAWTLARRPDGVPALSDFDLKALPDRALAEGEVRVANRFLSVDPYMRARMNEGRNYVAAFELGRPMDGGAVGEVIESRSDALPVGAHVLHMAGWRDEAVLSAKDRPHRLPETALPLDSWLHVMGLTGATAWMGLVLIADAKPGETLFVSAAAGAVGSAVVGIGKALGLTVIGSAGGEEKRAWVESIGADRAIDYKAGPIGPALREAAPGGIDIYFDNVGGDHLDAALMAARDGARFPVCGMIEGYNRGGGTTLKALPRLIQARIRMEGFLYTDHLSELPRFHAAMAGWLASGAVVPRTTVLRGLEAMPEAFRGLFEGANTGKMLVAL